MTRANQRRGRSNRRRGGDEERAVVKWIKKIDGWSAYRVPMSGAADGFPGDVRIESPHGLRYTVECKLRRDGFAQIYRWLGGADILTIRRSHGDRLVIMTDTAFEDLIQAQKVRE